MIRILFLALALAGLAALPASAARPTKTDARDVKLVAHTLGFEASDSATGRGLLTAVIVGTVEVGSQADKAGLKKGDAIVGFDGPIETVADLSRKLTKLKPGDTVGVVYYRGKDKPARATVRIGPLVPPPIIVSSPPEGTPMIPPAKP